MLCRRRRVWQTIGNIYSTKFKCWSINVPHRENLHVVRRIHFHGQSNASGESSPQDFRGQSVACDEIRSVGAESHSGMELKTTVKATKTNFKGIHTRVQTQWLADDTSDPLLYFLTTCTALCSRGTLKCLLMSVIIDKRVTREPRHRRNLRLNHLVWLPTLQQLDD